MSFKLLQLYRNYRNIKSVVAGFEDENFSVFGHFDYMRISSYDTADTTLTHLYKEYSQNKSDINTVSAQYELNKEADIQPIILYDRNDQFKIEDCDNKCVVVSFMQINHSTGNIDAFYDHAQKMIDDIIGKAKKEKLIGDNVQAHVYLPLSFMDIAVIFTADDFVDICVLLKNLIEARSVYFQYSVLSMQGMSENYKHKISISLRFIWEDDTEQADTINKLKTMLEKRGIDENHHKITHLIGNNDCLLTVTDYGYDILKMLLESRKTSNGEASGVFKKIKNTRASIRFNTEDIKIFEEKKKVPKVSIDDEDLSCSKLTDNLAAYKKGASDLVIRTINDLIYKIIEFEKFVRVIREHAKNRIAIPLYKSIRIPYRFFIELSADIVNSNKDNLDDVMEMISSTIAEMLSYYSNILHCTLGFFEERGFYNNIISFATIVELAYNRYANMVCDAILCDHERHTWKLQTCCYVVSDKKNIVCAEDKFDGIDRDDYERKLLICINIPMSCIFQYDQVSCFIAHEVAHYVGCREREKRAHILYDAISMALADVVYEFTALRSQEGNTKDERRLIEDYEKTDSFKLDWEWLKKSIKEYISSRVNQESGKKENGTLYMSKTIGILIDALNLLLMEDEFINQITKIISEYRFRFYENIMDFYVANEDRYKNTNNLLRQISDFCMVDFDNHFTAKGLKKTFNDILNGTYDSNTADNKSGGEERFTFPLIDRLIFNLSDAINEGYSDIMMITLLDMDSDRYEELMNIGGKTVENVINNHDYLNWFRMRFVAGYMHWDIDDLYKYADDYIWYCENTGIIDCVMQYFTQLLDKEFKKVKAEKQKNSALEAYIKDIAGDDQTMFKAIYNMYLGLQ